MVTRGVKIRKIQNKPKIGYFCLVIRKKIEIFTFQKTNSTFKETQALIHLNLETIIGSLKSLKARRHDVTQIIT